MMITYLKHMGKYTHQQLKNTNFEEVQKLYEREKKWIDDLKPMDGDCQLQIESTKKRSRAVSEVESSKKQKLEEEYSAKKRSLELISIYEMLNDFDGQDVIDLHRLVNERYETTSPKGYDLLLLGDLKILFKPKRKYPLTQEMLTRMLSRRLEVDQENTMAFELIKFIKSLLEEWKSVWIHSPNDQDADNEET
nr:hypothetical protein [Tanacetum cinerariifolium]